MADSSKSTEVDVVLIGAGIMSATLGTLLKQLEPNITIQVFERLDNAAAESSDAWNNAGTGHSAFCELNYTPEKEDGSIDTSKAVKIAESFETSKEFWSYLIDKNLIDVPESFIKRIPRMSFVWGDENVNYLRKRYDALTSCHLFKGMEYSENFDQIREWIPLVMEGRENNTPVAATKMDIGTDVNFGSLTRCLFKMLTKSGVTMHYNHEVRRLRQDNRGRWLIRVKDTNTEQRRTVSAKFVFIGAGGGALPLLLKSGIPEGKGFGGFPVSGQWLRCTNPEVIARHDAKVYGLAAVGSPPMSVPHLDSRLIKGKKELLFGPYAGFTTKFLKQDVSFFDLIKSIRFTNIWSMLAAGVRNIPLTRYLIKQVRLTPESRVDLLREYVPSAKLEDWQLEIAGQRVQVIKKDEEEGGILEFGTEVVSAADGSLASLLGASPGASTAVSIMLNLLQKCFKEQFHSPKWQQKLKEIIPSFGESLGSNEKLLQEIRQHTHKVLGMNSH